MVSEAGEHLVAYEPRGFACLLHRHVKFYHVQEKLEKQLILLVATLLGKGQVRFAIH